MRINGSGFELCTISLLVMPKYSGLKFFYFYWAHMGGGTIIPCSLQTKTNKKIYKLDQKISFLQIKFVPFIYFSNNMFSKIQSINSDRDGLMSPSWAKMSKFIPLSLKLSGIEFSLV
jgi:hypothetical protein